jgi:hypothetical protein
MSWKREKKKLNPPRFVFSAKYIIFCNELAICFLLALNFSPPIRLLPGQLKNPGLRSGRQLATTKTRV